MVRDVFKFLIPIVLGLALLLVARHLDASPKTVEPQPEQVQTQIGTAATENAQTVPSREETTPEETVPETTVPEETGSGEQSYTLTFMGNCTMGSFLFNRYIGEGFINTVGDDYSYPFRNVLSYLEEDDLSLVNLEGTFSAKGEPAKDKYCIWGPESHVNFLTQNSVELVSLANNHSHDYGAEGYESTKSVLKNSGVAYVETDDYTVMTLDGGLTVGVYGTCYFRPVDEAEITSVVQKMKAEGIDVIIYAPHWGYENAYEARAKQTDLAHAAIDAGADIVWGTHPYVLQPIEEYNGGIIYYALGNFCFTGNIDPDDYDTVLLQQEIVVDETGEATLGELKIIPCSSSSIPKRNNFQPTPYEKDSEGYRRVMEKLDCA